MRAYKPAFFYACNRSSEFAEGAFIIALKKYAFKKKDRLKSVKKISAVFEKGILFREGFLQLFLYTSPLPTLEIKTGVGIPKRKIPLAVDRNRIRRQIREIYRYELPGLKEELQKFPKRTHLFFTYRGACNPSFSDLKIAILKLIHRMIEHIKNDKENSVD